MGLFDMFKGDKGETMTPQLGFVISLVYVMGSDGEMDQEEVGHLLSVLGGERQGNVIGVGANNKELLEKAFRYVKSNSVERFLTEVTPLLSDAQRMAILVNLVDSSLSDGTPEHEEQILLQKFMHAFDIPETRFRPFFEVIALKSDRSVFFKNDHSMNQPGYEVRLSL